MRDEGIYRGASFFSICICYLWILQFPQHTHTHTHMNAHMRVSSSKAGTREHCLPIVDLLFIFQNRVLHSFVDLLLPHSSFCQEQSITILTELMTPSQPIRVLPWDFFPIDLVWGSQKTDLRRKSVAMGMASLRQC